MTDFDLDRRFDGAVCPINTLLHLTPDQLARHLECIARHTSRYLVQVGLIDRASHDPFAGSHWEAEREGTKLKIDWEDEEVDFEHGISRQRSRIEVLERPRQGDVLEEIHELTLWTPETWATAIDASPFEEVATFDGGRRGVRPEVGRAATGGLLWHDLAAYPERGIRVAVARIRRYAAAHSGRAPRESLTTPSSNRYQGGHP